MGVKKIKISATKRSKHLKSKKNVTSKPAKKLTQNPNQSKKGAQSQINKKSSNSPIKSNRKIKRKKSLNHEPSININLPENEIDSDVGEDMINMMDKEDIQFLTNNASSQSSYSMLSNISNTNNEKHKKGMKRKSNDDDINEYEKNYTEQYEIEQTENKKVRELLPIKTKTGFIPRTMEVEDDDYDDNNENEIEDENEEINDESEAELDTDDEIIGDETLSQPQEENKNTAVSVADLLIHREQEIQKQKFRIGIICSGILEQPESRMKNFSNLFELMEKVNKAGEANLVTVRKLAMVSALEVFKDILPEYRLGQVDLENVKVKKQTLERVSYENILLKQYKKYLQHLEQISLLITKRQNDRRVITEQQISLGEIATNCLCELLVSHPYFNYGQNIAQSLIYLLNNRLSQIRERVSRCFKEIFKTDKRLELTLYIVRRINHLVKTKQNNVHIEVLSSLIFLQIKDINLDADKEKEIKDKKMEARKSRLISLSKREKKRQKKLAELEKEMLETKAEENKQTRSQKLTEIIKMVFNIYFRILKNDPSSKLLAATLEGLAKFAHVINLEFFSDLVDVLNNIMANEGLGYREQLHCIQTVFTMLSGQGEALNIDPYRFYNHFYRNLLVVHAGKNHDDIVIILKTLVEVLVKRRKHITHQRLLAFTKRIMTLSLQLLHNGTLGCLGVIKSVMQLTSKSVDVLLDTETFVGSGRYDPELADPEYCNANCTLLYELGALGRHYHPTVIKMARHICNGAPTSGEGCLNPEIGKLMPDQLFEQYNSTQMAFNPAIPVPKKQEVKAQKGRFIFSNDQLEHECIISLKCELTKSGKIIDFYKDIAEKKKKIST